MTEKMKTITKDVEKILESYPLARGSDEKLYSYYLVRKKVQDVSAVEFFKNFKKYGVASFETVSRLRRKVQEVRKDLLPPEKIVKGRDELCGEFFDMARGL